MTRRIAAMALLDESLTVGDLRALVAFADSHGLDNDHIVIVDGDQEYPHQNSAIEITLPEVDA